MKVIKFGNNILVLWGWDFLKLNLCGEIFTFGEAYKNIWGTKYYHCWEANTKHTSSAVLFFYGRQSAIRTQISEILPPANTLMIPQADRPAYSIPQLILIFILFCSPKLTGKPFYSPNQICKFTLWISFYCNCTAHPLALFLT